MKKSSFQAELEDKAIGFVKHALELELRDYVEPNRAGVAKGDPIGFTKKKRFAAGICSLYPKVSLKRLAREAGVTPNVLAVWRTQDTFKKEEQRFAKEFATNLANIIVGGILEKIVKELRYKDGVRIGNSLFVPQTRYIGNENAYTNITGQVIVIDDSPSRKSKDFEKLQFDEDVLEMCAPVAIMLSPAALSHFLEVVCKGAAECFDHPSFATVMIVIKNTDFFLEDQSDEKKREWFMKVSALEKAVIFTAIDMLSNPNFHKEMGEVKVNETATIVKEVVDYIFKLFIER